MSPNGWKKLCESALTFDEHKTYCPLIQAYAEHARLNHARVTVPSKCCK